MKTRLLLHGVLAFAVLILCGSRASLAAIPLSHWPENPIGGSVVFVEKLCLRCHAIQGYGGTKGPDLGRLQLSGGFLGMAGVMWNHAPKMIEALAREKQPLPKFSISEMTQLVAFLYTLNYLDSQGDPREGEKTFAAKRCVDCHSVGGKGGERGPPLDKYGRFVSPLFIATALWNRGPAMAEAMKQAKIPRPVLSGRDVRDIVAFIQTRAKPWPAPLSVVPHVFVPPGNPRDGAYQFELKGCAICHPLYEGEPGAGPPLAERKLKVSLSVIASRLWNHSPDMWALWKKKKMPNISLKVSEMADITAYLYFLQFETPQGDPTRGAVLFASHGCEGCHKQAEKGKSVGPDLRTKGPWVSDIDLAREMWNHAGNMYGTLIASAREWPKLTEKEVADLLAYVRYIGGTKKQKEKKE